MTPDLVVNPVTLLPPLGLSARLKELPNASQGWLEVAA